MDSALNARQRRDALATLASDGVDMLVVGGGVVGAGIALDAAARGLSVGLIEAQDWAAGTSSRSSRLLQGWPRTPPREARTTATAARERALLLTTLAPHLVRPQAFVAPFRTPLVGRATASVGESFDDAVSLANNRLQRALPAPRQLTKRAALERFPALDPTKLAGALEVFDATVDDARLVVTLVRTAASYGTLAANHTALVGLVRDAAGRVTRARVRDLEGDAEFTVRARWIVTAMGVWSGNARQFAGLPPGPRAPMTKGIHLVIPRNRLRGQSGLLLRADDPALYVVPGPGGWVVGTTGTAWHEQLRHPVATDADIEVLLTHISRMLARPLTRDDVTTTWAGLRPATARVPLATEVTPGVTVVSSDRLATYRAVAAHAVDTALGKTEAKRRPSVTATTPLIGAPGLEAVTAQASHIARRFGWTPERVLGLLSRYGSDLDAVLAVVDTDPLLASPLVAEPRYTRAEVAFACTHEGALHLRDVLTTRVRLGTQHADRGASAVDEVAAIMAARLGWDPVQIAAEKQHAADAINATLCAERERTDAAASRARLVAKELTALP